MSKKFKRQYILTSQPNLSGSKFKWKLFRIKLTEYELLK